MYVSLKIYIYIYICVCVCVWVCVCVCVCLKSLLRKATESLAIGVYRKMTINIPAPPSCARPDKDQ